MDERPKEPVKVVDRRLFTPEGERRAPAEGTPAAAPPPPASPAPHQPEETPAGAAGSPIFGELVAFLADSAMYSLRAGAPISNFTIFIDFLETLREKTRGNLAPSDSQALEDTIGQMKVAYLQISSKKPGGKKP